MSDVKKIATREGYGKALVELGALHPEIVVLDADLAGATKTSMFRDAYPDRFIECGIAEANMMDVAAGLSTLGFVPFASSFALPTWRVRARRLASREFVWKSGSRKPQKAAERVPMPPPAATVPASRSRLTPMPMPPWTMGRGRVFPRMVTAIPGAPAPERPFRR